MTSLNSETVTIDGISTRVATSKAGTSAPAIFLHGGMPGVTPYCSGVHIWGDVLGQFAGHRQVLALDLPGSGGTAMPAGAMPTLEMWGAHVVGLLSQKAQGGVHIVGHEEGGLLALWLVLNAPEHVRSLTIVASKAAAPAGDSLPVLTLNNPPRPLWSAVSQAWALEHISYSHHHIDDALVSACVASANGDAHKAVLDGLKRGATAEFGRSAAKTKNQLFRTYREDGIPVPVQLVWGSNDPLTSIDRGFGMYEVIAKKQRATEFDIINRAGNLPFREEAQAFVDVVAAFHEAVDTQAFSPASAANR